MGIKVQSNTRSVIPPKELDIYLPENNLAIEFNGLHWHSDKILSNKNSSLDKLTNCEQKSIKLITIFEDEWKHSRNIVENKIRHILNVNNVTSIGARKCYIDSKVSSKEAREFCNRNHLQGYANCSHRFGLRDKDGVLAALMTFSIPSKAKGKTYKENTWELSRYCTSMRVQGGASKLLKSFIQSVHPETIYSYADKRWSDGNLYLKLGFELKGSTVPGYWYVINGKRYHRFKLRKQILVDKFGADPDMTEKQITERFGIPRIYDCGHYLFEINISNETRSKNRRKPSSRCNNRSLP